MPPPSVPQHCPSPRELDDLELLASGALAPTAAFNEPGSPVTLTLPAELGEAETVELVDPEGLPLARVSKATGELEVLSHHEHGPFRRLYLSPDQVREQYAGRTFVPVTGALTRAQLDELARLDRKLVLLALIGTGTPDLSPTATVRATLLAADRLGGAVVAIPLASHGDPEVDHDLGVRVVTAYAGPDPVHALAEPDPTSVEPVETTEGPTPTHSTPVEPVETTLTDLYPDDIAAIVAADQPPPDEQGLVLFFTGLSGSGKSTLARALMDRILEQTDRPVTSLDGDVVRRHLSAGLTFSKADRETNIRRIGWVAAEISRHGGIAVCSPIAPFAETREQVREMVDAAGGAFFLVHVATPLEECERRDRKGLYAKARRGEIPEFTGISSPYEEPDDAVVRVDTTGRSIEDALDDVTHALREHGYLDLQDAPP
ncbi:adenylyl-sulfate kinase [Nocardioides coralli]|uniref:adenylyl-sulfate kinase n=1 Tax=Nocardioides coralli TaxID=2872154 RepID=UPI002017609A|nr:adenylyl-sulfate kinase [Nocardioides coralli]